MDIPVPGREANTPQALQRTKLFVSDMLCDLLCY